MAHATITGLRSGQLAPAELAPALRHLSECEECRRLAASPEEERLAAALEQPDDERHLDLESEIFPYVDGTADDATRELVTSHVAECGVCRREVDDLLALRPRAGRARPRRRWPAFALAAGVLIALATLLALLIPRQQPAVPIVRKPLPPPQNAPREPMRRTPPPPPAAYARAEWQTLIERSRARGSLPVSSLVATVAQSPQTLRGPRDARRPGLAPAGVVIESDRPKLSWPETEGATYVVAIYDGDEEIAASGALARPSWTPPRRLRRGRTYAWQVKVQRGEESSLMPAPPAPQALFHVLSDAAVRELAAARAAHPDDPLLLAVLSARHGLVADADRHLRRLASRGEALTPDVRRLVERELAR